MKHKDNIISALFLVCVVTLTACTDVEPYGEKWIEESQLSAGESALSFDLNRSATVSVNDPKSMGWEARTSNSWIRINNERGYGSGSFSVSITEDNPDSTPRTGTIELVSLRNHQTSSIRVEQAGSIIDAPSSIVFSAMGESKSFTVNSNINWLINIDTLSWISDCSVRQGGAGATTITLTSRDNLDETETQGAITIRGEKSLVYKVVSLKREAVTLSAEDFTGWFGYDEKDAHTLNIKSNSAWKISEYSPWLKFSRYAGTKDYTITVSVQPNTGRERYGYFYINSGNVYRYVWVGQEGVPMPNENDNTTPKTSRKR